MYSVHLNTTIWVDTSKPEKKCLHNSFFSSIYPNNCTLRKDVSIFNIESNKIFFLVMLCIIHYLAKKKSCHFDLNQ